MTERFEVEAGTIDLAEGHLETPDGVVSLSANEVAILTTLHAAYPEPCSAQTLKVDALGYAPAVKSRTVVVTIQRLRKKIEVDPTRPATIRTRRGRGYALHLHDAPQRPAPPVTPGRREDDPEKAPSSPPGREVELSRIEEAVRQGAPVMLVGPGGAGKTTLARHWAQQRDALWVPLHEVSEATTLRRRIVSAAGRATEPDVDAAVREVFARRSVVLDNAEELGPDACTALASWLAPGARETLITSQQVLPIPTAVRIPVGELSFEAAEALLAKTRQQRGLPPIAPDRARSFLERIGTLPLAIVLAGPLLDLADDPLDLLDVPPDPQSGVDPHHHSIAAALERSLGELDGETSTVARALAAFARPASTSAVAQVSELDMGRVLRALGALRASGLAIVDNRTVDLLPVVRVLLRRDAGFAPFRERVVDWLTRIDPTPHQLELHRTEIENALSLSDGIARLHVLSLHIDVLFSCGPSADLVGESIRWSSGLPPALAAEVEVVRGRAALLSGDRDNGPLRIANAVPDALDPWLQVQGAAWAATALTWRAHPDAVRWAQLALDKADEGSLPLHIRVEALTYAGYALARAGQADGHVALATAADLGRKRLPARALEAAVTRAELSADADAIRAGVALLEEAGPTIGVVLKARFSARFASLLLDRGQTTSAWALLEPGLRTVPEDEEDHLAAAWLFAAARLVSFPDRVSQILKRLPTSPECAMIAAVAQQDVEALERIEDADLVAIGRARLTGTPIPDGPSWPSLRSALRAGTR